MTGVDCLVIGASGPIGRSLLDVLNHAGRSNIGVSRSTSPGVDISDIVQARELFGQLRPRNVVYLATPPPARLQTDPDLVKAGISTAESTARLAAEAEVRNFVYCSSSAVYGTTTGARIDESSPLLGTGGYAESKQASEEVVNEALTGTATRSLVLRVFNVYGPGCSHSLINRLWGNETEIWDTDRFVRDYVHVQDVARALERAINYEGSRALFNIGTGLGISNRQIIETVTPWQTLRVAPYDGPHSYSVADVSLAQHELEFTAQHQLLASLSSREAFQAIL